MTKPWWVRIPGRIEFELDALRDACSEVAILMQDDESGRLSVAFAFELDGTRYGLRAEFPAAYPYTRPMVYGDQRYFKWHQNPFGKNLCLLGRNAENWDPSYSLARHLTEQLPKLIASASTVNAQIAAELEELQAEPFTTFLEYQPNSSMLLLDSLATTDRSKGTFKANIAANAGALRGAVSGIRDDRSQLLLDVPPGSLAATNFSKTLCGNWYRLSERPQQASAIECIRQIVETYPQARKRRWTTHQGKRVEVIGVLVPEEVGWRETGESIFFVLVEQEKKPGGRTVETAKFIRTFRADPQSMSMRVPELSGLDSKRILIAGVGSIGAPCALEFARSGIGALNLLDGDFVEPGNSVRWPLGTLYAGAAKVAALQHFITANYPFTRVLPFPVDVGSEAYTLQIQDSAEKDIDLIFDATADRGISFLLADRARELNIPYVAISSTHGNWGGTVLAIRPGDTKGCWWCLCKHLEEGSLPLPSCGPVTSVQAAGCASPTFTGANFDAMEVSLMGVRLAVSILANGYPKYDWDYASVSLRTPGGDVAVPQWRTERLARHCSCSNHS